LTEADGSPLGSESQAAGAEPVLQTVETKAPGQTPLTEVAEPQVQAPEAPPPSEPGPTPEVAVAPRSEFPVVDILQGEGWRMLRRQSSK
jgi:hypothetical protein